MSPVLCIRVGFHGSPEVFRSTTHHKLISRYWFQDMQTSEGCEFWTSRSRANTFPFHSVDHNPNNYYNSKYKCRDFNKDVSFSFLLLLGLGIFHSSPPSPPQHTYGIFRHLELLDVQKDDNIRAFTGEVCFLDNKMLVLISSSSSFPCPSFQRSSWTPLGWALLFKQGCSFGITASVLASVSIFLSYFLFVSVILLSLFAPQKAYFGL